MKRSNLINTFFLLKIIGMLLILYSCKKSDDVEEIKPNISDVIKSAVIVGNYGLFYNDELPEPTNSFTPTIRGSSHIVRGGSVILLIESVEICREVLIGIPAMFDTTQDYLNVGFANASQGYFVITVPDNNNLKHENQFEGIPVLNRQKIAHAKLKNTTDVLQSSTSEVYILIITFSKTTPYTLFKLNIAIKTNSGISRYVEHTVRVSPVAAGSDFLQVSLNWAYPVDLDLHVETPNGNDIFYGTPVGQNGGVFDLDSNPACNLDNVNNENITWGPNLPAIGEYKIRVDLWSSCNYFKPIPFVVTLNNKNNITIYTGEFSPSDETYGGAFSGRLITTFDFEI